MWLYDSGFRLAPVPFYNNEEFEINKMFLHYCINIGIKIANNLLIDLIKGKIYYVEKEYSSFHQYFCFSIHFKLSYPALLWR